MKVLSTVPGTNSGPENVSFLSFPSKSLKIEKNEGVPLVFVDGERPQWEHLPLAVVPNQAVRHLSSPPSNHKPCALQTPSASLVSVGLGLRWDPRSLSLSLPHFLNPVGQPKISGV